ncbi:MAG: C4-type zinc ribbon domain-containing protein [Thermodesulfobacteriota bacterium]
MNLQDDIRRLMELQQIDLQARKLDQEIIAGENEISRRRGRIEQYRQEIADLETRRAACEEKKRELEGEIENEYARVKDRQGKMMGVQTNREYQSLLKEIEDGKEANKQREDEVVLLLEEIESIDKKLAELNNVCSAEDGLLSEEIGKVEERNTDLVNQKATIVASRELKTKELNPAVLKRYELLRQKRNGLAIVGVSEGVCLGCNMNIPPQMFNNLRRAEEILSCPLCNRLMFYQAKETAEA